MSIRGLLNCQPKNAPHCGDTAKYTIENKTSASGVAWTKIKRDKEGQVYEVISVEKTDRDPDTYGNESFNLEIQPASGNGQAQASQNAPSVSPDARGDVGTMSKDDYWQRKEERDIEASRRMGRAHCHKVAVELLGLQAREGVVVQEDMADKAFDMVVALADKFEADLSKKP